jgi:methionyl-tRNA formyltransferase
MILQQFNTIYPELIKKVLEDIKKNQVRLSPQDHSKGVYFGKRTPEDGQINWAWSKERIRNWIRAQAKPYPGAFTFYKGEKLNIHEAVFSDLGFHYQQVDGTILWANDDQLIVKTPNGALILKQLESKQKLVFETGSILS